MNNMIICAKCNIEKSRDHFANSKKSKTGKKTQCKACSNLANRKYESSLDITPYMRRKLGIKTQKQTKLEIKYKLAEGGFKECVTLGCGLKPISEFHVNKAKKDGYHYLCKSCVSRKSALSYEKNKDIIKKKATDYYNKNKEAALKVANERAKRRRKEDPYYKVVRNLRNRLYYALINPNWKKNTHFSQYIGCDRETLMNHLSSKFKDNMSFENYGEWHIDHIIPLSSAKSEEELYRLCHYTNLQPLWGIDNIKKGNKA